MDIGVTEQQELEDDDLFLSIPDSTWEEQGLFVFMVLEDLVVQSRPTLLVAGRTKECGIDAARVAQSASMIHTNELVAVDLIQRATFSTPTTRAKHLNNSKNNENFSKYSQQMISVRSNGQFSGDGSVVSSSRTDNGESASNVSRSRSHQQQHEGIVAVDFVRLADRSGWLPVQQFFIQKPQHDPQVHATHNNEIQVGGIIGKRAGLAVAGIVSVDRLRQVDVERGLWPMYVDNVPDGQVLRRHPMMQPQQQLLRPQTLMATPKEKSISNFSSVALELPRPRCSTSSANNNKSTVVVKYQPMQKVYCDARVLHPISGIQFYHVQSSVAGWLMDHHLPTLSDPIPRSLLLTSECVQAGCFCFRALYDLTIQPTPSISDSASKGEKTTTNVANTIEQGQVVAVDIIRSSPEYDVAGDGPFLRLSDGSGWLFVHKHQRRVMTQIKVQQGLWQVRVLDTYDNGVELRRHPCQRRLDIENARPQDELDALLDRSFSDTTIAPTTIFPPNTILQCDYQMVDYGVVGTPTHEQMRRAVTFYHVCNTQGWIMDRRPAEPGREEYSISSSSGMTELIQVLSGPPVVSPNDSSDDEVPKAVVDLTIAPWTLDFLRGVAACHALEEEFYQEVPQQVLILSMSSSPSSLLAPSSSSLLASSSSSLGIDGQSIKNCSSHRGSLSVTFHVFAKTCSVSYMVHRTKKKRYATRIERKGSKHKKGTYKCNGLKLSQQEDDSDKIEILQQRDYLQCSHQALIGAIRDGLAALAEQEKHPGVVYKDSSKDEEPEEVEPSDPVLEARDTAIRDTKEKKKDSKNTSPVTQRTNPVSKVEKCSSIDADCNDDYDDDNTMVHVDKDDVHIVVPTGDDNASTNDENIESVWKPHVMQPQRRSREGTQGIGSSRASINGPLPSFRQETIPTAPSTTSEESTVGDDEESNPTSASKDKELSLRLQLQDCELELGQMQEQYRLLLMAVHEYDVHRFREATNFKKKEHERKEESLARFAEERLKSSSKSTATHFTKKQSRHRRSGTAEALLPSDSRSRCGVEKSGQSASKMIGSSAETPPRAQRRNSETAMPHKLHCSSFSSKSEGRRSTKEIVTRVLSSLDDDNHSPPMDDHRPPKKQQQHGGANSTDSSIGSRSKSHSSKPASDNNRGNIFRTLKKKTHALYRCDECHQEFNEPLRSEEDENIASVCRQCHDRAINPSTSMDPLEQRRAERLEDDSTLDGDDSLANELDD
ncbi:hypothetical protein ACA910_021295 [Epithemia clementina (nom. ined.)]